MAHANTWKNNLYKQTIHPLISIAVPFTFLVAATLIMETLPGVSSLAGVYHYALILGSGVLKVIMNKIFNKERIDKWNILREFILTSVLAYALFSIIKQGDFLERFTPERQNLYPMLLFLVQWLITFRLHTLFHNRELFLDVVKEKQGEALLLEIRNSAELASEAHADLNRFKSIFIVLWFFLLAFFIFTAVLKVKPDWLVFTWTGLFLLTLFLSAMAINLFRQEYGDLGEGFNVCRQTQKKRFYLSLFFVSACILLGMLFSGNVPLLTPPRLKLPTAPHALPDLTPFSVPTAQPYAINRELLESLDSGLPDLSLLFSVIGLILGAFLIVLILIALLLPLFSPTLYNWLKRRKFIGFLVTRLHTFFLYLFRLFFDLVLFFKSLFTPQKRTGRINPFHNEVMRGKNKNASFKKIRETNKVIKLFLKLIQWGKKQGIGYHYSETVLEYITDLYAKYPDLEAQLISVAAIFEESLFSSHLLPSQVLNKYKAQILSISRLK